MGTPGRTEKPIDWDKLDRYIRSGATQKKIAAHLLLEPDTLRKRVKDKYGVEYSVYSAALQSEGELMLECAQFEKALNKKHPGDVTMLIHLGKTRLGQKDNSVQLELTDDATRMFVDLMGQLKDSQTSSNSDCTNINIESKS